MQKVIEDVFAIIREREGDYGHPATMYEEVGRRWGVTPRQAALWLADMKMARLQYAWKDDSAKDAIAYLLFAVVLGEGEEVTREEEKPSLAGGPGYWALLGRIAGDWEWRGR